MTGGGGDWASCEEANTRGMNIIVSYEQHTFCF